MSFALKLRLLSSTIMSLVLCSTMVAWVTWLNLGFSADFFSRWGHSFVMAWPAAFTLVMAVGPSVQRFALRVLQEHPGAPTKLPLGVAQPSKA